MPTTTTTTSKTTTSVNNAIKYAGNIGGKKSNSTIKLDNNKCKK